MAISALLGAAKAAKATEGTGLGSKLGGKNLGAIGQLGLAGAQAVGAIVGRKKADAQLPPVEGILDRRMYNLLNREINARKLSTMGTKGAALRQALKSSEKNMMKTGGINYSTIDAMRGQIASDMFQTQGADLQNYFGMLQKQSTDMQDLRNEIAMLRSNRTSALAESRAASAGDNLTNLLFGKKKK